MKRNENERRKVYLHFLSVHTTCVSKATLHHCKWACVCMLNVLTEAAGAADICLCLSVEQTATLSLFHHISPISTLPCSKPHQHVNTHTHRYTHRLVSSTQRVPHISASAPPKTTSWTTTEEDSASGGCGSTYFRHCIIPLRAKNKQK